MFKIGDWVIYSAHGLCKIEDICEKSVLGTTKNYYILHPLEDKHHLKISAPVDNDKVVMLELMEKEDAIEILDSFKEIGVEWHEKPNRRLQLFTEIIKQGNRKEIAKVINTLLRKKMEAENQDKKIYEQDLRLLNDTQHILFKELSIVLNTTFEKIQNKVINNIKENY